MRDHEKTDLQTVRKRLIVRNEHLERQLAAALATVGLSRAQLAGLPALASGIDLRDLADAEERWAGQPQFPGMSWEEISRPSLCDLSSRHRGPLLRA